MRYDICAIGNALVDLEFNVTDDELLDLGIEKAQMTLMDADRRLELLHRLKDQTPRRTGGGSAGNTIVALQQLGGQAFYSCRVADDAFGRFYADDLAAHGIQSCVHHSKTDGHTGTCLVMITPDAERTMCTHLSVSAELNASDVDAAAIRSSAIYYMEGYLAASPSGLAATILGRTIATEAGVQLALTLSDVSMIQFCRAGLEAMLGDGVDFLFANEAEIKAWFGESDFDALIPSAAALAKMVCITRGADGCVILHAGEIIQVASPKVKPIDTNGAGDMFAGAFLYAIRQGQSPERAGALATHAASAVVAQHGNRMPTATLQSIRDEWATAQ